MSKHNNGYPEGIKSTIENTNINVKVIEPEAVEQSDISTIKVVNEPLPNRRPVSKEISIARRAVNIRKEPSADAEILGKAYDGELYDILDDDVNGYVKLTEDRGYIRKDLVTFR